jgi:hypothetical protein
MDTSKLQRTWFPDLGDYDEPEGASDWDRRVAGWYGISVAELFRQRAEDDIPCW